MTLGMLAKQRGDALAAERHSQEAIRYYERARRDSTAQVGEEAEDGALEDTDNTLSGGFHLLGDGLLAQGKAQDAQEAYEKALTRRRCSAPARGTAGAARGYRARRRRRGTPALSPRATPARPPRSPVCVRV